MVLDAVDAMPLEAGVVNARGSGGPCLLAGGERHPLDIRVGRSVVAIGVGGGTSAAVLGTVLHYRGGCDGRLPGCCPGVAALRGVRSRHPATGIGDAPRSRGRAGTSVERYCLPSTAVTHCRRPSTRCRSLCVRPDRRVSVPARHAKPRSAAAALPAAARPARSRPGRRRRTRSPAATSARSVFPAARGATNSRHHSSPPLNCAGQIRTMASDGVNPYLARSSSRSSQKPRPSSPTSTALPSTRPSTSWPNAA